MAYHHYIISVDTESGEWVIDTEQEELRFPDGTVYNEDTNEWASEYLGDGEFLPHSAKLMKQLTGLLEQLNKGKA